MLRVADFVQVLKELAKSLLLQSNIHLQRVVHGRSPNFNPAFRDVGPLVLHLQLVPAFVESVRFRDGGLEDTEQSNCPEQTRHRRKGGFCDRSTPPAAFSTLTLYPKPSGTM